MRYLKAAAWVIVILAVLAVAHYNLPQNDVVRIVNTEVRRVDFGNNSLFWAQSDSGTTALGSRDVRFIETIQPDGDPMVFRNEDTGWGWPPYLKFNSSNLQAVAQDLVSTRESPAWVAVRHYGWRNEWFSIFPNALAITQVAGPDVSVFPWRAVIAVVVLLLLLILVAVLLRLLKIAVLDPFVGGVRSRFR